MYVCRFFINQLRSSVLIYLYVATLMFTASIGYADQPNASGHTKIPVASEIDLKLRHNVQHISERFSIKIVLHLPEKMQKIVPDTVFASNADLDTIIRGLDDTVGIRWAKMPGLLALSPSTLPGSLELKQEVENRFTGKNLGYSPGQQLVKSFSREQFDMLKRGSPISVKDLNTNQLSIVREIFATNHNSFASFVEKGFIECYLDTQSPWAFVFVEGHSIAPQQDLNSFKGYLQTYNRAVAGPKVDNLLQDVQQIIETDPKITFNDTTTMTFEEAVTKSMQNSKQPKPLIVSELLRNKQLIITKGEYLASELLAFSLFAVRGVVRQIGDVFHLAPETYRGLGSPLDIREFQIQQDVQSMQVWQDFVPVIKALEESSKSGPSQFGGIHPMKLIPWTALTASQRELVLEAADLESKSLQKILPSSEIIIGPVIMCEFKLEGEDKYNLIGGVGFGLPGLYRAIALFSRDLFEDKQ